MVVDAGRTASAILPQTGYTDSTSTAVESLDAGDLGGASTPRKVISDGERMHDVDVSELTTSVIRTFIGNIDEQRARRGFVLTKDSPRFLRKSPP